MTTHSSILACRIPWTGEPGVLQPTGLKNADSTHQLKSKSKVPHNVHSLSSDTLLENQWDKSKPFSSLGALEASEKGYHVVLIIC